MLHLQIKWLLIFVWFITVGNKVFSQILVPDATSSPDVKSALAFYNTSLFEQLHLYNGAEYIGYPRKFVAGHPYFATSDWSNGTVNYDGNTYTDVSILYDLVADELVILSSNKISRIRLLKEKVEGFSLSGHSFLNLRPDSLPATGMSPGFYDVAASGRVSLIIRRTKNIQSYITQVIELKVFARDHYYLKKNNNYYPIHTKKSLLQLLDDHKKEVQQYIRSSRLRFKKDHENTMVKIVEYYNQLTK